MAKELFNLEGCNFEDLFNLEGDTCLGSIDSEADLKPRPGININHARNVAHLLTVAVSPWQTDQMSLFASGAEMTISQLSILR